MSDISIDELVRDTLAKSKEPDPRVVGRRLWPKLTPAQKETIGVWGIEQKALELNRHQRIGPTDAAPAIPAGRGGRDSRGRRVGGASRYVALGVHQWALPLGTRVSVGERKFYGDCTIAELEVLAEAYGKLAADNVAKQAGVRSDIEELRRSGYATPSARQAANGRKAKKAA